MLVSLRLLLVQVINQCCEESAGSRLAAAALLVTCRGWGSELGCGVGLSVQQLSLRLIELPKLGHVIC